MAMGSPFLVVRFCTVEAMPASQMVRSSSTARISVTPSSAVCS